MIKKQKNGLLYYGNLGNNNNLLKGYDVKKTKKWPFVLREFGK